VELVQKSSKTFPNPLDVRSFILYNPPMHRPSIPTTTNVSDLLNTIYNFVHHFPDWADDEEMLKRMMSAYTILTKLCEPDHLTEEEFSFVMDIFNTCNERNLR